MFYFLNKQYMMPPKTYIFFIHFGRLGVGAFHLGFSVPTAVCGYVLADCIPPLCLSGPSRTSGRLVIASLAIFNETMIVHKVLR